MDRSTALTAALVIAGCIGVFAAKPSVAVAEGNRADQAASDRSAERAGKSHPDGMFHGDRHMDRHEMEQINARRMAQEDRMRQEQQDLLDRPSGEPAKEPADSGKASGKKAVRFSLNGELTVNFSDYGSVKLVNYPPPIVFDA